MEHIDIVSAVLRDRVRVTRHAYEEADNDQIDIAEVYHAALFGEVIESYPDDYPLPSCLVFGRTVGGDPVHSVWGYDEQMKYCYLVTVYRPDPDLWIDWTARR